MVTNDVDFAEQLKYMVRGGAVQLQTMTPEEWTESRVIMGDPRPGPFRYDFTPYMREPVNFFDPTNPYREATLMKGSQIGGSSGVLFPAIGYNIEINPGNCYLMVGTAELVEKAMGKLDLLIQNAGLRDLLKPQVQRKRNQKTGDTNDMKEFIGGYVFVGSPNNHKSIAQVDLRDILLDDLDAMKATSKEAGSMLKLFGMRSAAYANSRKMMKVSTPLLKKTSLIYPSYMAGPRRRWHIECPNCHEPIVWDWEVKEGQVMNELTGEKAVCNGGIVWEVDHHDILIDDRIGYVCYKCGGFHDDKMKQDQLMGGYYVSTAQSKDPEHVSWHVSSLYAPPGMYQWRYYIKSWLDAHPRGQEPKKMDLQVFYNTGLGLPFDDDGGVAAKASDLMKNMRGYLPGVVPETISIADGNGHIVMLTCGVDLNGKKDDARLDYEIVAWSESEASYSVLHGSIGTFERGQTEEQAAQRVHWTYEHNQPNCVWPELERIISQRYQTDTGRNYMVYLTAVDCRYHTAMAYAFLERTPRHVIGVMGQGDDKYLRPDTMARGYKSAQNRTDLFILKVGIYKERMAEYIALNWERGTAQPPNYMNFPSTDEKLYLYDNYFSHYEAEHRQPVIDKDGLEQFRWVKRDSTVKNHFYDTRVYNMAAKEIVLWLEAKYTGQKEYTWAMAVAAVKAAMRES